MVFNLNKMPSRIAKCNRKGTFYQKTDKSPQNAPVKPSFNPWNNGVFLPRVTLDVGNGSEAMADG